MNDVKMSIVSNMEPSKIRYLPTEWREYASGGAAAVVNIAITFPLNKTMFRQMVHGISVTEAMKQLYHEGAVKLYRGALPPLGQQAVTRSLMFGNYALFTRRIRDYYPHLNPTTVLASAAFLAGCTEALLTPFERVQVLLQDSKQHANYTNTADALRKLRANFGLREYYRGATAILLRNGPSNMIFFYARERVREKLPLELRQRDAEESSIKWRAYIADFLCGSITGAVISTLFYPVNVTKTHMQLKVGGSFLSFFSVFKKLLEDRGLRGMFRGVHLNYSRSFISWGIINTTYGIVHEYLLETC